ncbi:tyrosine-type recombinase/integrase [Agromyces intestinalis]|uniref:Tyrosine-type recombinase/integrase n=1 Tax=Agromyces intestinalis TaxID=2592652 RepID=A0A5C1YCN6_9MICO|nr:tyrosine-type recombinase/integrase [Agromyces intestinalis]QEO13115.1 tyrosine-type recombinase/integrase [Agromyces intestinalis]
MAGRKRLPIGTFGEITVQKIAVRKYRASTRYRDWDGVTRQVSWTAESRAAAAWALKKELTGRMRLGDGADGLSADSPFSDLAAAWLEDMRRDHDLADNTKETYERELRTLVMPTFGNFTVREVTVGRVESFLKTQRAKSYPRAKHSRTILGMVMSFAVRREIVPRNPVKETSRLKKPKHVPKALTPAQIAQIRVAARTWRTEEGRYGPRPDGQIRDLIEVMLGTAIRIGEALALRRCDVDMTADPPRVYITGTIIVSKGKGVFRQSHPKTHESNRVIAVPPFAAEVIRRRLALIARDDEEALLFHSRKGTPLTPNNARRTFRAILASAGMDDMEITPHAFRRTGATLLANEVSIQAAADVLGHTSTSTTKEHYAEPDRSVNPAAAEVLQRLAPDD